MAEGKGDLWRLSERVVEGVLREHGDRGREFFYSGRVKETRRHEAAAWLRDIVGVIGAKDLPPEPSEEEFKYGLKNGIILCKALNKIQPGAVPKVVENPCDSGPIPDGAALIAYQQFENLRNFLESSQEIGLPTFDAPDLQQGGNTSRVVNTVLAMKSYHEWKRGGAQGVWKVGGNVKTDAPTKSFVRKNSEPFTSFLSRSRQELSTSNVNTNESSKEMTGSSLSMLLRAILSDKNSEEIPNLVESLLRKVMEQLENHIANQTEMKKAENRSPSSSSSCTQNKIDRNDDEISNGSSGSRFLKQKMLKQHKDIKALKQTLCSTRSGMQLMQMKFHDEFNKLGSCLQGLAHAASNYHRVLEENRKLYNEVQDLKGSIRVYCRVRPFLPGQCDYVTTVDHINEGTITINTLAKNGKGLRSFSFNKVFGASATQEEIYADTQPLVRSVLDGYNVCIFAYGQTGSGKTYTMTGPADIKQSSEGVNYRALSDLFLLAEQRKDTYCYQISVQMIEIYNEQVRDLLLTDGLSKRLEIRNSSQTGLNVPDASLVRVSSSSDVIELMNIGLNNRAVGATALNDRSSRSHSCLTVHVQGKDLASGGVLRGCMHLVDLAGSERVDKSEVMGDRLKEARHINKSLSALGDVISSLAQKNSHVPYRNSKLTQLLQDSLGGQAKTLMFVHISPEPDAIGETISTLKFAERVASVELGAALVNKDSADVKALKEQIATLKAALARKDGERSPVHCKAQTSPLSGLRKPMEELSNIEQALSPIHGSSPMWSSRPRSPCQVENAGWIDKLMVNKLDPMISWSSNNDHSIIFKPMYSSDNTDDTVADAGSSDSSVAESMCQLQYPKLEKAAGGRKATDRHHAATVHGNGSFRSMIPRPVQSPPPPPKGVASQAYSRRSETKRMPKFRN